MMKCRNNKYKKAIEDYRNIIGEQTEQIKELKFKIKEQEAEKNLYLNKIKKLKEEIDTIKKYRACQDHKFKEYYQFYLKDRNRYIELLKINKIIQ